MYAVHGNLKSISTADFPWVRTFLIGLLVSAIVTRVVAGNSGGSDLVDVSNQNQLLVDDFVIAEKNLLTRELGQVEKLNGGKPIFADGRFYGTVHFHDQRFKLWWRKPSTDGYGYAESKDGIHFEKRADLTGINFAGDYTLAVELDRQDPNPAHRFKAAYDAPGMAAGIAYSADGIRWIPYNDARPVTGRAADTYNQILWDDIAGTYRLFTRTDFGPAGGDTELRGTRSMTNRDLKVEPTNWKMVRQWKFDREGPAESARRQIYAVTCWIHDGVYFALLSVYEHVADFSEGVTTDLQKRHERDVMNFYIATSRDCDSWDLQWVYASQPMIPRGPDGAFDKDLLLPASTVVTHQDRHWLYYSGANERHGNEKVHFDRVSAIGVATLKLNRFVSLTGARIPGTLMTKPMRWTGRELMINADASEGIIQVELFDEQGRPIETHSGNNAAVGKGIDELRWVPTWNGQSDLSMFAGKILRVKVTLRNSKLYGFQFQ